jgi:hypothetical protein
LTSTSKKGTNLFSRGFKSEVHLNKNKSVPFSFHQSMMQFHPGARVSFSSPQGERVLATIMKFNRKTVTVVTDSGQRWNVSPHLLSAVKDAAQSSVIDGRLEND